MGAAHLLFLGFLCILAGFNQASEVSVHLDYVPSEWGLKINFTLSNPSSEAAVSVLTWATPFDEDVYARYFEVIDSNGESVRYLGKVARRVWPPAAESYISLAPRGIISKVIDIAYLYDLNQPGYIYSIRFLSPQFDQSLMFSESNIIVGRLGRINKPSGNDAGTVLNTNCKTTEDSQIPTAVTGAKAETLRAYRCMNGNTCSDLAVRWFGTYTKTNYDYDKGVFEKVNTRLNQYAFNAYCNPAGCGSNVYAYVYPNDPKYTVYLCGAFWSQANERVNTVVHEMSHFDTLGATDDYAYGKTACLNLAKSNPTRASHNADNVCYFSEESKVLTDAFDGIDHF